MLHCLTNQFRRFISDDTGQDLIEYAILTALVAVGSVLLFSALAVTMRNAYEGNQGWNQSTQNAWAPCAPVSLGGCPNP